jgi:hypothetical protein
MCGLKDIQIQEDDDDKPQGEDEEEPSVHQKVHELARKALLGVSFTVVICWAVFIIAS